MRFAMKIMSPLLIAFCPPPVGSLVSAQTLEVTPVTVDLPSGGLTSTLQITNRGSLPTTIQVRPFAWSQPAGKDQLDPTPELLVSPPFCTLGAGESQTVRLVLRRPATTGEAAFRLLVDELPPAVAPGSVRVALRLSLPVFAAPAVVARPALSWKVADGQDGVPALVVRNDGARRIRLSDLRLSGKGLSATASGFSFRYVLAGSEIAIPVQIRADAGAPPPTAIRVAANSDQGRIDVDAPVSPSR